MIQDYIIRKNGTDITDDVKPYLKKISLQDNMGMEADTLDFIINDTNLYFDEVFEQSDTIEVEIAKEKGETLKTGKFFIDDIDLDIDPNILSVGMTSNPNDRPGLNKQITYSKRRVRLHILLKDVLKRADMDLVYRFMQAPGKPWSIKLQRVSIMDDTIGAVVADHANTFGCMLKIHDDRVIFSDKNSFNSDPVVRVIDPKTYSLENLKANLSAFQYQNFAIRYYNPRTGKVTLDKKNSKSKLIVKNELTKQIHDRIDDVYQARAIAQSVEGQDLVEINFNTKGDPVMVAGSVIEMTELKKLSGKYVITSASHDIDDAWNTGIKAVNLF